MCNIFLMRRLSLVPAAGLLKELMTSYQVQSALANALSAVHTPSQPHAAVKQVMTRVSVIKKHETLPHLEGWNRLCLQLAPSAVTNADHTQFLTEMHPSCSKRHPTLIGLKLHFKYS